MNKTKTVAKKKPETVINKSLAIQPAPTLETILMKAVDNNSSVDVLERLVALKERIDAKDAERAFNEAMAKFQSECPIIYKKTDGAKVKATGKTAWKYAALEDIEPIIREPLAKNGLSYKWNSEDIERNGKPAKKTICIITHTLGHSNPAMFTSGIDGGTNVMNDLQKEGSTIEYGRRQSLKLALGLIISGEDDDGTASSSVQLTDEQVRNLEEGVSGFEQLKEKLLKAYNLKELKYLPSEKYDECLSRINAYMDNLAGKKNGNN